MDAGDLFCGDTAVQPEAMKEAIDRAPLFVDAMNQMGYAALGVGERDLAFGLDKLRAMEKRAKFPFLSSNIRDAKTGKLVFKDGVVKQVGPLKVGLFALLKPFAGDLDKVTTPNGVKLDPPKAAAERATKALRAQGADVVILLAQLGRPDLDELESIRGITLILGSNDMGLPSVSRPIGAAYAADALSRGKYLAVFTLEPKVSKTTYVDVNRRGSLEADRAELTGQIQNLTNQLEQANRPGSGLSLNDEGRKHIERQIVAARARIQRLGIEIEDAKTPAGNESLVRFESFPLTLGIEDEPRIKAALDTFHKKWPAKPGH